ncbi:hypothetical protein [Geodermatophilus normandii]|uniref:Uncharacterized protein n=1 Tax=Geodermatophilus normandii TaxID=1137989 RepID=A0A6P0GAE8_9ACTN|nr:hypothetical protein [Geodermatophilus normandii]NEM05176.1 hypothetical protein [Geodermatophilus normandii]
MRKAGEVAQQLAVYTFEGPSVLYVHPSIAAAESSFEAIDVENDEYIFFGQDGTVIQPSVKAGRVVLTAIPEQRADELRQRLRTYLDHSGRLDPKLADDTVSLAQLLLDQERAFRESRWPSRFSRALTRRRTR